MSYPLPHLPNTYKLKTQVAGSLLNGMHVICTLMLKNLLLKYLVRPSLSLLFKISLSILKDLFFHINFEALTFL